MFNILFIKLDLYISRNPIICQDCMEVSKKCLSFKYTCNATEKIILSYPANRENVKDTINVINEGTAHVRIVFDEDFNICRFCMNRLERNNLGSLDTLINERVLEILSKYITEVDFCTIEKSIICANCRIHFEDYFKFMLNCVNVEEKIKTYCEKNGTHSTGQVKLSSVLSFALTYVLELPNKCSPTCKMERGHIECADVKAHSVLIKQEDLDIKDEETILNRDCCRLFPPKENYSETKSDMICSGTKEYNTEEHIDKYNVQLRSAGDSSLHEDVLKVKPIGSSVVEIINKHTMHSDETREKRNCRNHLNDCTNVLELDIYEDVLCTSEIQLESFSKDHISSFNGISEDKQTEMLTQMDTSDVQNISVDIDVSPMFKCSLCTNVYKHRSSLKTHMLVHKDVSEIQMFKCSLCTYESKYEGRVKSHMLVHKNISETKMYKCSFCPYGGKSKAYLKKHMLIHMDISEVKASKCSSCAHEFKTKAELKYHMSVHKEVTEIKMFKCFLCAYQSKRKNHLITHMLVHKSPSEIEMFKCSLCSYEAKQKRNLKSHMLIHTKVSETEMYKCSLCAHKTKYKKNLKIHMLIHEDVSEIQMFKCSLCVFKSKYRNSLKMHISVHGDVSEIQLYKCSLCAYEFKRKCNLKRHIRETMGRCAL